MDRLSGDQNGWLAASVPGSGRASRLSSMRTHRVVLPDSSMAVNASFRPSGEIVPPAAAKLPLTAWNIILLRQLPLHPVLTADTAVVLNGVIYGKPTKANARSKDAGE